MQDIFVVVGEEWVGGGGGRGLSNILDVVWLPYPQHAMSYNMLWFSFILGSNFIFLCF